MEKKKLESGIARLEDILKDFREAKTMGKETNSNKERAQSISEIEDITRQLETYIRNNDELLEQITGSKIELTGNIDWNDIVRPEHFEEDLEGEIIKLKKQVS